MRILLLTATQAELDQLNLPSSPKRQIETFITGVGPSFALANLLRYYSVHSNETFDYIIQVGLGGCFDHSVNLGAVFCIENDQFLAGAWENESTFKSVDEMGFNSSLIHIGYDFQTVQSIVESLQIPGAKAITVSTIESLAHRNLVLKDSFKDVKIESMEGACLYEIAPFFKAKAIQLRAVSNYVGERDKSNWNFGIAFAALSKITNQVIDKIYENEN